MSIKLLLADDSITIQKVVGIIFGGEEYSLTVVDNGKDAVQKARELCPDVLLVDAVMPGMTGYEVCEAVRAIPELAAKPILILTGSFEPFDEEKAKKCGADDFLAKPFESQQIVGKVKELFELGASRASASIVGQPATLSESVAAFAASAAPAPLSPPEASPLNAPSDIWGAFTPDTETSAVTTVSPEPIETGSTDFLEPDVFAIVNEETDSQIVQTAAVPSSSHHHTGSQWIPVEETTFEFEEENVADIPDAAFPGQMVPVDDSDFGGISFEDEVPAQELQVSETNIETAASDFLAAEPEISPLVAESVPYFEPETSVFEPPEPAFIAQSAGFDEASAPPAVLPVTTVADMGALSEEQLKEAISMASKDIIERIVWEVVPDLAEAMIREAIRKIKEGV